MFQDPVLQSLLQFAKSDENIRAVFLEGSRANPKGKVDRFSDYDLALITRSNEPYINQVWADSFFTSFGEIAVCQTPDKPKLFSNAHHPLEHYAYLVQFMSGLRLDLTFKTFHFLNTTSLDSAILVLLDKDQRFVKFGTPTDQDFLIQRPSEMEFLACCNEFWWTTPYVAKALSRKQLLTALELLNCTVRCEFTKMLTYLTGIQTNFAKSVGKYNTEVEKYIPKKFSQVLFSSYPRANFLEIQMALKILIQTFPQVAEQVGHSLNFVYNRQESEKTIKFLQKFYGISFD